MWGNPSLPCHWLHFWEIRERRYKVLSYNGCWHLGVELGERSGVVTPLFCFCHCYPLLCLATHTAAPCSWSPWDSRGHQVAEQGTGIKREDPLTLASPMVRSGVPHGLRGAVPHSSLVIDPPVLTAVGINQRGLGTAAGWHLEFRRIFNTLKFPSVPKWKEKNFS